MPCTVFANDDGFFSKNSMGTGKAFPDVCLSPPPPPAGPVPVPYNNILMASDLTQGSKSVTVDGAETALEDSSYVAMSSGDEGGTQGGGVVTHKIKGKGYFMLWSFDVKVEGKGVDRHTDPMGQNCGSPPLNGLDDAAKVIAEKAEKAKKKCDKPYSKKDRHGSPTTAQKDAVNKGGESCWECGSASAKGWKVPPQKGPPPVAGVANDVPGGRFVADHQPPCMVTYYAGGCKDEDDQKEKVKDVKAVRPHCRQCSSRQGGIMSGYKRVLEAAHGR
jgi:hypothetical protein